MFEYAKRFKEQVYAEGKAEGIIEGKAEGKTEGKTETLNAFREAQRRGIPLEEVLETYDTENANKTNDADTAKRDS